MPDLACIANYEFWGFVVILWVVGILGIIISSMAIHNVKKLNEMKGQNGKKSNTIFPVAMLIFFILLLIGASIYTYWSTYGKEGSLKGYLRWTNPNDTTMDFLNRI